MTVMTELFSPPTDQNSVRLAALMETLPLSRSSVFEIIRHLGIDTIKHSSGTGSRVALLNRDDAAAVCTAAMDVYAGRTRICDLLPAAPPVEPVELSSLPIWCPSRSGVSVVECHVAQPFASLASWA